MTDAVLWALAGTGFSFFMTAAGSAMVFILKKEDIFLQRIFLGFAAGVMIAASVWSLLIPASEMAEEAGVAGWIPSCGGFILGVAFLLVLDRFIPHVHPGSDVVEGVPVHMKRSSLLMIAVTLHNIPEGMAVGLSFAAAAHSAAYGDAGAAGMLPALILAGGIGLQNFPEGAAVSMPLYKDGFRKRKAFLMGAASGAVEPLFGLCMVFAAGSIVPVLPWLLAFAAGAMMYVVVEELIPEAHLGDHSNTGTLGVLSGFLVMMALDVIFAV